MTGSPERLTSALSDRYRIERELGKGGMATVYLAEDLRHGRKVAVKVLLPELAAVLGAERFLSEIHVTAALQHPHILPLFDSGQADGQLFYVMPYVEGESLRSRLDRERQLPIDDALRIAREVGSALSYAHRHHVIHRDIKPENILLHDGHALVADFGIALAVTSAGGGRLTQTGLSLGTPQYMSPEQATGEREIDARSDLYSLAAVTYEMLASEPPHTGNTMQAVIARMLTERPRSVRSLRPSVPDHVASALDVALERIPADRWNSIDEFENALDGKIVRSGTGGRDTIAAPRKSSASSRTSILRHPVTIGLAAVALIASAVAVTSMVNRKAPQESPTVRFVLSPPRGAEYTPTTQTVFAISPDGKWIVVRARVGPNPGVLYLRSVDNPELIPLPGTSNLSLNAWFSPDSRWLGFATPTGLAKISLTTRDVVQIAPNKGIYGGASWAGDGRLVASMNNSRLYVIPENGGPETKLCGKSGDSILAQISPVVLADGETVLFAGSTATSINDSRLAVASLKTGECKLLDQLAIQPLGVADDIVTYVTASGTIMGARYNARARTIEGTAVPLVSDVDINQTTGSAQAGMSATGSLVYLAAGGANRIVKVDSKGQATPLLTDERAYAYPRYSPDGRKIAVAIATAGQRDIWVVDVNGQTVSRLSSGGSINDRPEWTPDGKRILYRTSRTPRSSIWWRSADQSDNETSLLNDDKEDYYEGVITPDGKWLVYQSDTAGADIGALSLAGDKKKTGIVASQFVENEGRVSPDGKWLAYVTDESGSNEIFVQPFPGPGARVQVSSRGGDEPLWSPNGSKLYYRDEQNVMVVTYNATSGFQVTGRQPLFPDVFVKRSLPHANYDVSRDGSSFLFLQSTPKSDAVVVYNWIAEVRARLKDASR
ncbi:MAG TPA: protein kinase [Gemmatimonadaceae bacterium]|nr:protein kinase [Gemmatimonadaceae bacterium]